MNFPSGEQMEAYKKAATPPTIREVVSEQSLAGLVLLLRHNASVACGPEPYLYHSEVKPVNCDKLGEFLNAVADRLERLMEEGGRPRNCDRYNSGDPVKDADNAYAEWQRQCEDVGIPPSCKLESAFRQWVFRRA